MSMGVNLPNEMLWSLFFLCEHGYKDQAFVRRFEAAASLQMWMFWMVFDVADHADIALVFPRPFARGLADGPTRPATL